MEPCKEHPPNRIQVNLLNKLFCTLCNNLVEDYVVCRTDSDRDV